MIGIGLEILRQRQGREQTEPGLLLHTLSFPISTLLACVKMLHPSPLSIHPSIHSASSFSSFFLFNVVVVVVVPCCYCFCYLFVNKRSGCHQRLAQEDGLNAFAAPCSKTNYSVTLQIAFCLTQ
jgi:hypothetical protein